METDEKHFNDLQMKTRALASTWILAGFGGIAFFMKPDAPPIGSLSNYTMINLIGVMVVCGLFALWVLDQLVYQKLLNANFVAGLYKEFSDPRTPPVRFLMVVGAEHRGMSAWYNLFYFFPMIAFNVFSAFAMWLDHAPPAANSKADYSSSVFGVLLILMTLLIWKYIYDKKRSVPYVNLLQSFGSSEFAGLADPVKSQEVCTRVIRDWQAASKTEEATLQAR